MKAFLTKNIHHILTGVGVASAGATLVITYMNAPKAQQVIEYYKNEYDSFKEVPKWEFTKDFGKYMLPPILTTTAAILAIVGLNIVHCRRYAALAALYGISEQAFTTYKDKVKQIFGEKKEEEIRNEISKDILVNRPIQEDNYTKTLHGDVDFYDPITDRYFSSDIEYVRRIVSDLNVCLFKDDIVTLNEFYYALGLSASKYGDNMGWHSSNEEISMNFNTQLSSKGKPCVVLDYGVIPLGNWPVF